MRKISGLQILVFALAVALALGAALLSNTQLLGNLPLGDFRGIVLSISGLIFLYLYAIAIYRGLLWAVPITTGEYANDSREEFVFHVYLLFYLLLFVPVMRCGFIPIPLMRLFYQGLGAKLGANSYSSGIIFDPPFVEIGSNCIIGQSALIVPHVIEGNRLAMYAVRIGNDVTVGANAVILPDVIIGNHAIVAAGAIVSKGTRIGDGEFWGGVPAKRLK